MKMIAKYKWWLFLASGIIALVYFGFFGKNPWFRSADTDDAPAAGAAASTEKANAVPAESLAAAINPSVARNFAAGYAKLRN